MKILDLVHFYNKKHERIQFFKNEGMHFLNACNEIRFKKKKYFIY